MPDQDDIYEPDVDGDDESPDTPNDDQRGDYVVRVNRQQIRSLEEKAKRAKNLETENTQLQRTNLMLQAGIDLTSDRGKFFAEGYKGELTVEAVKAQATTLGFIGAAAPSAADNESPDTPLEEGEAALAADRRDLAQGSPADSPAPPNPYERADEIGQEIRAGGGKEKEAVGAGLNYLVNAAAQGDKRVIIPSHSIAARGGGD